MPHGPWPTPHDPIFDFTVTPPGFEWLDEFAQQASDVLVATTHRPTSFTAVERHVALNAAYWVLAYNARCILSFLGAGSVPPTGSALAALSDHRDEYRRLT